MNNWSKHGISWIVLAMTIASQLMACANHQEQIRLRVERLRAEALSRDPQPPNPFRSDGCSCWFDWDWVDCCVDHDFIYWAGGTREERKNADLQLMHCVAATGHPFMGKVMYLGVRAGAVWWLPTPFRWGFGWNYPQSGPPGVPY